MRNRISFRSKSHARIIDPAKAVKWFVLVTDDMSLATAFCDRAILLEMGHVVADGDSAKMTELHEEHPERSQVDCGATIGRCIAEIETGVPRA